LELERRMFAATSEVHVSEDPGICEIRTDRDAVQVGRFVGSKRSI
jgi:hypothetical protein